MSVLALELSTSLGSIAFRVNGAEFVRHFPADRKDSGLFFENLSAVRRECGLPKTIAVGLGPGSYAGTRIAIATALGLRAASAARLVGLPSICAIDLLEYIVVGDARRSSYFFAHVRNGVCVEGPFLLSEAELSGRLDRCKNIPFVASAPLPQFIGLKLAHPSASLVAALAEDTAGDAENLEPIYLRQPYITTPKSNSWTR